MITYADTSALAALLIAQPNTTQLRQWLDNQDTTFVACDLLETELRRIAVREGIDQINVTKILHGVSLASLDRASFRAAGILPFPYLRAVDALHLQAALQLNADAVLTYDHRLSTAASALGLRTFAP